MALLTSIRKSLSVCSFSVLRSHFIDLLVHGFLFFLQVTLKLCVASLTGDDPRRSLQTQTAHYFFHKSEASPSRGTSPVKSCQKSSLIPLVLLRKSRMLPTLRDSPSLPCPSSHGWLAFLHASLVRRQKPWLPLLQRPPLVPGELRCLHSIRSERADILGCLAPNQYT